MSCVNTIINSRSEEEEKNITAMHESEKKRKEVGRRKHEKPG